MIESDAAGPGREMPRYKSHKVVWALEIAEIGDSDLGNGGACVLTFEDGYVLVVAGGEMFARYNPKPGDFYVVYADGYKSFSPRKAFLEGYTREDAR